MIYHRDEEMAMIDSLISKKGVHMIVGPTGVGKTSMIVNLLNGKNLYMDVEALNGREIFKELYRTLTKGGVGYYRFSTLLSLGRIGELAVIDGLWETNMATMMNYRRILRKLFNTVILVFSADGKAPNEAIRIKPLSMDDGLDVLSRAGYGHWLEKVAGLWKKIGYADLRTAMLNIAAESGVSGPLFRRIRDISMRLRSPVVPIMLERLAFNALHGNVTLTPDLSKYLTERLRGLGLRESASPLKILSHYRIILRGRNLLVYDRVFMGFYGGTSRVELLTDPRTTLSAASKLLEKDDPFFRIISSYMVYNKGNERVNRRGRHQL